MRARVDYAIGTIKRIFNFTKVRYRGLAKNVNRLFVAAALGQPVHGAQAIAGIATPVVGQERTGRPRVDSSSKLSHRARPILSHLFVEEFGYSDVDKSTGISAS